LHSNGKPENLVSLVEGSVSKFPDNPVFGTKNKSGEYEWISYRSLGDKIDCLRGGLAALGVKKGDFIGLIGPNSVSWAAAAYASYGLGARFVPMYEAELPSIWRYIVNDAPVKILFVSTEAVYEKAKDIQKDIRSLEAIYLIDGDGEKSMARLQQIGSENPVPSIHPSPDDIAELIYTSGTTGDPKGVLLSHGNLTTNCQAGWYAYPELDESCRSLSILPWAHSYGQTAELNCFLQFGGSIGFAENVTTIVDDLQKVRPTHLIAVPRVFNKIYNGLWTKMNESGGLPKKLFVMGVKSAEKKRELNEQGRSDFGVNLKLKIADKIVFKKIRAKFGGRLQASLTASATMNVKIAQFFFDIGVPVYDCYGLTETSPALTINCPKDYKLGTVGKPIIDSRVVIDTSFGDPEIGDGEIIAYGPNVMKGYHKKARETADVMTEDGGFRTGDLGKLDKDGFLIVTGRIKEQYKLENGKYVFPASIEEEIKLLPSVANAMVSGEGRAFNICLVVPNFEFLTSFIKTNNLPNEPEELIKLDMFKNKINTDIIEILTGKFGGYEIPKRFVFLADDFTTENGMLTQTMKLKRRAVVEKYKKEIETQYI
jgi:long-chain acyl-CoA synthetase